MEIYETAPPDPPVRATTPPASSGDRGGFKAFGDDGPTFLDILDIINPLQHIPIVSTLYRAWTGDEIDPVPRIAGGGLFGGVIGAVTALVNVVVEELTGSDFGEHVLALFEGEDVMVAERDVAPSPVAAADSSSSPLVVHAGVLEWARGEAAFMAAARTGSSGPRFDLHA